MFPLKKRAIGGYRFGQKVNYGSGGQHTGTDYKCNYEPLYAPFDGVVTKGFTTGGGNFITLVRPNGDALTSRHLSKILKTGQVKEGEQIAITGGRLGDPTAGIYTSNPHLHQEVKINGKLIDPEKYQWEHMITIKAKVVINQPEWGSLQAKLDAIREWYRTHSNGQLDIQFAYEYSQFADIDWRTEPYTESAIISEAWFDAHVLDARYDTTIFVVRDEDLPDTFILPSGQKAKLLARTLGYFGRKPTKTYVGCAENDLSENYPNENAFFDYVRHELMHSCFMWSGEFKDGQYFGNDQTHKYFYTQKQPTGAFSELNYSNIDKSLTESSMTNVKLVKRGNEYGFYIPATTGETLIDKALNFGYHLPTKVEAGKTVVDWDKVQPDFSL